MSAPLATDHLRLGMTLPLRRANAPRSEHGPEGAGGPSLAFDAHFQRTEQGVPARVVEDERPSSVELDTQIEENTLSDAGEETRQTPEDPTLHDLSAPVETAEMQVESESFLSTSLAPLETIRDGGTGHSIGSLAQETSDDGGDAPDKVSSSESAGIVAGLTGGDALNASHAVKRIAASMGPDVTGGQTLTRRSGVFEPGRDSVGSGRFLSRYAEIDEGDQGAEARRQDTGRSGGMADLVKPRVSSSGRIQEGVIGEGRYALPKGHSFPFALGPTHLTGHEPVSTLSAEIAPPPVQLQLSNRGFSVQVSGFGSEITSEDFEAMPVSELRQAFASTASMISQGNPLLYRADVPQFIAHQIAVATYRSGDGNRSVELLLTPEELGRVRLKLTSNEGVMTVNVAADRPETLDLMRRHIDTLARAMLEIGFERAQFSFDGGSQGATGRSNTKPHQEREVKDERNFAVSAEPGAITPVTLRMMSGERLNVLI